MLMLVISVYFLYFLTYKQVPQSRFINFQLKYFGVSLLNPVAKNIFIHHTLTFPNLITNSSVLVSTLEKVILNQCF